MNQDENLSATVEVLLFGFSNEHTVGRICVDISDPATLNAAATAAKAWWFVAAGEDPRAFGLRAMLAAHVLETETDTERSHPFANDLLTKAFREKAARLYTRLEPLKITPNGPCEEVPVEDGILSWDARLTSFAASIGLEGQKWAKVVRAKSADRLRDFCPDGCIANLFRLWVPCTEANTILPVSLVGLARVIWRDLVQPELARASHLRTTLECVRYKEDNYTKIPKMVSPISWAWGSSGVPAATVINSDSYATAPKLIEEAALLPKSWALFPPDHYRRPHLTSLPLDGSKGDTLPVALASGQSSMMSTISAKLALVILASPQVRAGNLAKSTLGELTAWTRPPQLRLRSRDHETTARSLDELRSLFIFLPDNTKVQVFDIQSPGRPEDAAPDMLLHYGLTGTFTEALARANRGELGGQHILAGRPLQGQEYRGEFLLNLTGIMRLPNTQPNLLRYYIRFAAHWNAAFCASNGAFDAEKMLARSLEDWAALANALPPNVVEYLSAKRMGQATQDQRRRLSEERKHAREDLEALEGEYKLIRILKVGDLWKPLPPDDYHAAWGVFRAQGGRPLCGWE